MANSDCVRLQLWLTQSLRKQSVIRNRRIFFFEICGVNPSPAFLLRKKFEKSIQA